ncbi:TPA: hypothetical protein ACG0A2_001929 [Enterobacter hormaechei subsp. steigerwaltii]|nr:hypothetical protein [Enterobacter hormaechei subsp. xiangfangensis]HDT1431678.1 hypothetical protein [Enterobacter hormaechei subsp. steigerwaltii]
MKVLLVGSLNTIFIFSYADYFIAKGYSVFILNTSSTVDINSTKYTGINLYEIKNNNTSDFGKIKKIVSYFKLDTMNIFWWLYSNFFEKKTLAISQQKIIRGVFEKYGFDFAFCFWGTTLRKEVDTIKKILRQSGSQTKLILSVSTYPVRYNVSKQRGFSWLLLKKDKKYFDLFDGLIISGELMKRAIIDYLSYKKKYLIMKDFLPSHFFGNDENKSKKDLIFLGNVRFSERTLDNVSSQLLAIADAGINVWVQYPCDLAHVNIKTFKPFSLQAISNGDLGRFMANFKASVVLYNNADNLRMGTTFPTRFALGMLGCHPVFIPAGIFNTLEDLGDFVLTYHDIDELINKFSSIQDKNINMRNYMLDGEVNKKRLDDFIKGVLNDN